MRSVDVAAFLAHPVLRSTDPPERRESLQTLVLTMCAAFSMSGVSCLATAPKDYFWFDISVCALSLLFYVGMCFGLRKYCAEAVLCAYTVCIFVLDYLGLTLLTRWWMLIVIVADAALVLQVRSAAMQGIVVSTVMWLAWVTYDVGGGGNFRAVRDWDGFEFTHENMPEPCDCARPPCVINVWRSIADNGTVIGVFLLDFYLTRRFSASMRQQMAVVENTVRLTETITHQISKYQVDSAQRVVCGAQGKDLPPRLRGALTDLLHNLREFQPYLPDALLRKVAQQDVELPDDAAPEVAPGLGLPRPTVTMCFTDMQSSTELWERHPQGMVQAMQLHNAAIRLVARQHRGYEVKVIGDAFMLAFQEPLEACLFALEIQTSLIDVNWPTDLLEHPLCTPTCADSGTMLWRGPRVRIGVHVGEVTVDTNPITGRCDYFGGTVNIAARVESSLRHGGLTGVTHQVMRMVEGHLGRLGSPYRRDLGRQALKGVTEEVVVFVLLPRELASRIDAVVPVTSQSDLSRRRSPAVSVGSPVLTGSEIGSICHTPAEMLSFVFHRSHATCITARMMVDSLADQSGAGPASLLGLLEASADVTQGVVLAVLSAHTIVLWNGPQSCADHFSQSLDFLVRMRQGTFRCCFGACDGVVYHGTVAAARRKYLNACGGCVEVSQRLAETAELHSEAVLAAGEFAQYCESETQACRVHVWSTMKEPRSFFVWSVNAVRAEEDDKWVTVMLSPSAARVHRPWGLREYDGLYMAAAKSGDHSEVRRLAEAGNLEARDFLSRLSVGSVQFHAIPSAFGLR